MFVIRHVALAMVALTLLPTGLVWAQLPATRLTSIFPAGANPGQSVEVTVGGADLDDGEKLLFSHSGITAKRKMAEPGQFDRGPQPVDNQFVISVAGNTPLGVYEARLAGKYGVSNPRIFVVGDLPEALEKEPNNDRENAGEFATPIVINGAATAAGDVDYIKVKAKAGQRLIVDCAALRIDSLMDPIVVLYDSAGREVATGRRGRGGDTMVEVAAKSDGDYLVKVHDALFRGGPEYYYRLSVGPLPRIDYIFPPAGVPGGNRSFTIFGRNLPGGQDAKMTVDGLPRQKLTVSIPLPNGAETEALKLSGFVPAESAGLDGMEYRLKGSTSFSNPVLIGYATAPVVNEVEPNSTSDKAQKVTVPCEIAGQFYPRGDKDWIQFEAKKGDVYAMEVVSQRLGLDTDVKMLVQQLTPQKEGPPQVKQVAVIDDAGSADGGGFNIRTDDPYYRFTAPADATYRVQVSDAYARFRTDPRNVYRLAIRAEKADFRLAVAPMTDTGAVLLRKGGQAGLRVVAFRRDGFKEPIEVSASGLPANVTCPPATIGPGRNSCVLFLRAADNAAPNTGSLQVVGKSKIGGAQVTRVARIAASVHPATPRQGNNPERPSSMRIAKEILVSVSASEKAIIALTIGDGKIIETSRAARVKVPYTLLRTNNYKGNVQIRGADLPPNLTIPNVTANGTTTKGEIELRLTSNTPVGLYTFYLNGTAQNLPYARNPEAAKKAAARKAELDKVAMAAADADKAAKAKKATIDKAATAAAAALAAAKTERDASKQALTAADAALKLATQNAARANDLLQKTPTDAALKAAKAAADKAIADATTKAVAAKQKLAAAEKKTADAETKSKTAVADKEKSDKEAADADARNKAAVAARAAADKRAKDLANAAKPKNRNVVFASTPITVRIAPAPIKLKVNPLGKPFKQGEKAEATVSIERLFAYNEQVSLSLVAPSGVGGVSAPNVNIPKGKNEGKLAIALADNAKVGKHAFTVRVTLRLNNQTLTVNQPLELEIQPKPEPEKKK